MSNKKEEQQRKTHNIRVRLDAAQYDLIQSAASSAGMSISEYIRRQAVYGKVEIHNHIVADFPKLEKLAQEFGAIGNNLNQLTRYFHMGGLKVSTTSSAGGLKWPLQGPFVFPPKGGLTNHSSCYWWPLKSGYY